MTTQNAALSFPPHAIAVVGMACRLPGADSPEAFWRLLSTGQEAITRFTPEELAAAGTDRTVSGQPGYVPAKGVLAGADAFDAGFFGFSPYEAALMDPQQRIFVECAWAALEHAGYEPKRIAGPVGVFAGSILSTYLLRNLWPNRRLVEEAGTFQVAVGNDPTFLATRVAYLLDLKGPGVSVGTACSTSLVAVHLACQSLLARESDMALAGGVSLHLPLVGGYRYEEGGILSPDGHCRPFDAAAAGTVSSDGAGVVVLKRLADALADGDTIHAVIRGSAVNNDGRDKVGFTAPSVAPQARVIAEALAMAEVEPATLVMLEAHAAGTLLGDPIEVAALGEVFRATDRGTDCAIGSVKSNIGHVDAAAGIAGLIKTVLALRHRAIPPTLHYQAPNARIDFGKTPFYVPTELRLYDGAGPMRAGVSSFGIGGTNVHVVLEEPPASPPPASPWPEELLLVSARSPAALGAATRRLAEHLRQHPDVALGDVGHTLRQGRRCFDHRRFVVAGTAADAAERLGDDGPQPTPMAVAPTERRGVTFMFPGLGDHYPAMGWELYCVEPAFRRAIDECAGLLRHHRDGDIRNVLYAGRDWSRPTLAPAADRGAKLDMRAMLRRDRLAPGADPVDLPEAGQPAIFVTEYALAQMLRHWGIEPDAMIGYSIGEFVAACLAGVFPLPEAIGVVAARANLIQAHVGRGAMLAVPLGELELEGRLPAGAAIGAVSGPRLTIVSGSLEGVAALERRLEMDGVSSQRLASPYAYHSPMMDPIVDALAAVVAASRPQPPRIPWVSCLTGTWISDAEATDPYYWARHLCRTVRFQDGLVRLLDDPGRILLEVGPGQSLTSHALAARARLGRDALPAIPTMRWSYGGESELTVLLRGVGLLWQAGAPIDMTRLVAREGARRVPLPTYAFERQRHWIDPPATGQMSEAVTADVRRPLEEWFHLPYWKPTQPAKVGSNMAGTWLLFADGGVGIALAERLRQLGARVVTVTPGARFQAGVDTVTLNPAGAKDYDTLAHTLRQLQALPDRVLHLWPLTPGEGGALDSARFAAAQELGFHSLMRLFPALWREGVHNLRVDIVASGLFDVSGHEVLRPEQATLLGPTMVAPQERPGTVCRCLDTDLPPDDPDRHAELVAQILAECATETSAPAIAWRRGQRWQQDYEPVRLEGPEAGALPPLRQRGVYLLTGGLGAVGLAMARYLARTVQARLVLVGRSPFPPPADWPRWLAEHPADQTTLRIRQLQELAALGAEVLTLSADVADRAAMRDVLAHTVARFGTLHGVFHGAGAIGVETFREIAQATTQDAETQFNAKAYGLLVLDQVLADRDLDFCVLMSSLAAILGGLGFAAYSAANLFLDAFARLRRRTGGVPWISINWDSWRLSDLRPAITGPGGTVSSFFMQAEEAASACERIIALRAAPQVVVSTGDLAGRLRQWVTRERQGDAPPLTLHQRPALRTGYARPRGQLEQALAEIWRDLFAIDLIGIHDNFFELGGHSLLATQLSARISSRLGVDISLSTVLQAPTITEMAEAIVSAQAARADPETLDRMLAEVGDLSAEELERLLTEDGETHVTVAGHE